jgi:hypothetical protein
MNGAVLGEGRGAGPERELLSANREHRQQDRCDDEQKLPPTMSETKVTGGVNRSVANRRQRS